MGTRRSGTPTCASGIKSRSAAGTCALAATAAATTAATARSPASFPGIPQTAAATCSTAPAGARAACTTRSTTPASSARTSAGTAALRRQNQLQHFIGIFKNIAELVALPTQHLGGELRGNLESGNRTVLGHETNFVYFDTRIPGQSGLQLFRERTGFRVARGKCPHESCELPLEKVWSEMDAGDSGVGQQLRKGFFRRARGAHWHAVHQDLVSGGSQQQPSIRALVQRRPQFFPGAFKLRSSAQMPELVEPGELQQDIQAAYKRTRRLSSIAAHLPRSYLSSPYSYTRLHPPAKQAPRAPLSPSD